MLSEAGKTRRAEQTMLIEIGLSLLALLEAHQPAQPAAIRAFKSMQKAISDLAERRMHDASSEGKPC